MNKLAAVSSIIIILLSAVCGVLVYQIGDVQTQISDLENQNIVLEGQVSEYQNQTSQLENQITELETQLDDLEAQNLELQNHTGELESQLSALENATLVQITDIKKIDAWNPTGVAIFVELNVTVQNFGVNDVERLLLVVDHVSGSFSNSTKWIGPINAGEERTFKTMGTCNYAHPLSFVVTLKLDDIILYERTHHFPW